MGELQQLSHDIKNALHGVSLNLEVARNRINSMPVESERIAPFLENAAEQLDTATKLHQDFVRLAISLSETL